MRLISCVWINIVRLIVGWACVMSDESIEALKKREAEEEVIIVIIV